MLYDGLLSVREKQSPTRCRSLWQDDDDEEEEERSLLDTLLFGLHRIVYDRAWHIFLSMTMFVSVCLPVCAVEFAMNVCVCALHRLFEPDRSLCLPVMEIYGLQRNTPLLLARDTTSSCSSLQPPTPSISHFSFCSL